MAMMFFAIITLICLQGCMSQFIDNPANVTILTGQPYLMSCGLQFSPSHPPIMQWLKDGQIREVNFPDPRLAITYDVSTGISLYNISSVQYIDAGQYFCESLDENSQTLFTSYPATVVVNGLPEFISQLQPQSGSVGGSARFQCSAEATPSFTFQWSFNDQVITNGGQYQIGDVGTLSILTVTNLQSSNQGFYKCSATNTFGTISTSALLTVTSGTLINPVVTITEGSSLNVGQGGSLLLHCTVSVSGDVITSIRWLRSGVEIASGVAKSSNGATLSFSSIALSSSGTYVCDASTSSGGTAQDSISLSVVAFPIISITPSSSNAIAGQFLSGPDVPTCSFTGGTNGDLVWRGPSGAEVPHLSGRLNINRALTLSDSGTYTCVGANLAGTATATFTLTVNSFPSFTTQPSNIIVSFGQDLFLPCSAIGNPTPTVSWSKSGLPIQAQAVRLPIGLNLYSVSSSDDGIYTCSATNSVGTNNSIASITVTIPPHINSISPSSDFYLSIGSTFTITCDISIQQGSVVHWYHNGSRVQENNRVVMTQESTMLYTLTITNAIFSDNGVYTCNVTNNFVFDYVSLDVIVGIGASIITGPVSVNVSQSENVLLQCVSGGVPTPSVSWYKRDEDGMNETLLGHFGSSHRLETNGLRLFNTQRSDSGYYRCVVNNNVDRVNETARVRVEGIPVAVSITPLVLIAGTSDRLQCNVFYDYPNPIYQWFGPGNQPLDPNRFSIDSNGDLLVDPVDGIDQMEFVCRVTNPYGSSAITQSIIVHIPPVVSLSKSQVTAILDSNLTLTCSSAGRPNPTLAMFYPNGELIGTDFFDPLTGILEISSFQVAQVGVYTCVASNIAGVSNTSTLVDIRGAPSRNLLLSVLNSRQIRAQWNPPESQFLSKFLSYNILYGVRDLNERQLLNSIGPSILLDNLEEYTEYEIEIRGVYSGGVEGIGIVDTAITGQAIPTGVPLNITTRPLVEGLELSWLPLNRFDQNGIILNYTIYLRETNSTDDFVTYVYRPSGDVNESLSLNLTGLNGGASYDIKMQAYNSLGAGPNSSIVKGVPIRAFPLVAVLASTIPVVVIALVGFGVLIVFACYKCVIWAKKAQLYSPKKAEEGKEKKAKKEKQKKDDVSSPVPEIPPAVDSSRKGKFTIQRKDGTTIPSHPKVIQPHDVAEKRKSGAKVVSVKNERESVEDDEYNPYDVPTTVPKKKDKSKTDKRRDDQHKDKQRRDGFVPRDSKSSSGGIYEQPRYTPHEKGGTKKESKSSIYDDVSIDEAPVVVEPIREVSDEDREEDDDIVLPVSITPVHQMGQKKKRQEDEEELVPVSITPKHPVGQNKQQQQRQQQQQQQRQQQQRQQQQRQQQQRQQQQQRDDEDEDSLVELPVVIKPRQGGKAPPSRGQQEVESEEDSEEDSQDESEEEEDSTHDTHNDRQNIYARVPPAHVDKKRSKMLKEKAKMDEKRRKEQAKMIAKKRQEQMKQKKKLEEQRKKEMKARMKRQSLGLDNVMSLRQLDLSTRAGRQMRYSIDSSSADMF